MPARQQSRLGSHAASQSLAPTTLLTDNFNRIATPLGTTSDGLKTWRGGSSVGTWGADGNVVSCSTPTAGANRVLVDAGQPRSSGFTLKVDLVNIGTSTALGLFFGCTDENNGYVCEFNDATGGGHIYKEVSGVFTSLVALSAVALAGDTMVVVVTASTITVKKITSGVTTTLATSADTTFTTGSMVGLYANGSSSGHPTFDNLLLTT